MSARAWKPGDVALVRNEYDVWNVAICAVRASQSGFVWSYGVADATAPLTAEARPLVVIDPEDAEQVERLSAIYEAQPFSESEIDAMQAALREFANPRPQKPEEPTGLGAVVEDAEGSDWHRTSTGRWISEDGLRCRAGGWTHVDAVRVLSEGLS